MTEPILKVKNLSVAFGPLPTLEGVSFELRPGHSLAIIGPNGAGKTVLFRALIGVLPYKGEIQWDEKAKIGYVPQRLELDPQLSLALKDLLSLKVRILKLSSDVIPRVLKLTHLSEQDLKSRLVNMAAGKLQRALIALALIGEPNVLLFDEPTAGIDWPREERIYETIHELQREKNLSLILISHDLNLIYRYADQVLCVDRQMLCFGEPQGALTSELLTKLYGERVHYHHHH